MSRVEFTSATKRLAIKRSGGFCEGMIGERRCSAPLSQGVQFDHVDADYFSKDNSLENCAAICPRCHKDKTRGDVKKIAKSKRIQDREMGIRRSTSRPIPGSKASGIRKRMNGQVERRT